MFKYLVTILLITWPVFIMADDDFAEKGAASIDGAVNPNPDAKDVILPMPCNLKMALRYVCVPPKSLLEDLQFKTTCGQDCDPSDVKYMRGTRQVAISGAFSINDLPKSWQKLLKDDPKCWTGAAPANKDTKTPKTEPSFYFLGKYEVSKLQWRVMMDVSTGQSCPTTALTEDDLKPKADVSWFDAVDFTRRYTEWLLKEKNQPLPVFPDGGTGYIRLPTEMEWEYAARGGQEVTINPNNFSFPQRLDKPETFSEFLEAHANASPSKMSIKLAPIGQKKPTPVGFFDLYGNVAEMTLDTFSFTVANRSHGSSGGFVRKGGSYISSENHQLLPGWRDERPFFNNQGSFHESDLGFRVALSALLMPKRDSSVDRHKLFDEAWDYISKSQIVNNPPQGKVPDLAAVATIDRSVDIESAIDKLIKSTTDKTLQQNLGFIIGQIRSDNSVIREQKATSAHGLILSALFAAETVRNYDIRRQNISNRLAETIQKREKFLLKYKGEKLDAQTQEILKQVDKNIVDDEEAEAKLKHAMEEGLSFYMDVLQQSMDYKSDLFSQQMSNVNRELLNEGKFGEILIHRFNDFSEHLAEFKKNGPSIRDKVSKRLVK